MLRSARSYPKNEYNLLYNLHIGNRVGLPRVDAGMNEAGFNWQGERAQKGIRSCDLIPFCADLCGRCCLLPLSFPRACQLDSQQTASQQQYRGRLGYRGRGMEPQLVLHRIGLPVSCIIQVQDNDLVKALKTNFTLSSGQRWQAKGQAIGRGGDFVFLQPNCLLHRRSELSGRYAR